MTDRPWTMPLTPSKTSRDHVSDFLGLDPSPGSGGKGGMPRAPRTPDPLGDQPVVSKIPELDVLFAVQKDLSKLFDALGDLEGEIEDNTAADDHTRRIRRQAEFAYRSIRSWLEAHA